MYIADYFLLNTFYEAVDTILVLHITIRESLVGETT